MRNPQSKFSDRTVNSIILAALLLAAIGLYQILRSAVQAAMNLRLMLLARIDANALLADHLEFATIVALAAAGGAAVMSIIHNVTQRA